MVGNASLMFFLLCNACLIGFKLADILNHINGEAMLLPSPAYMKFRRKEAMYCMKIWT